MINEDRCKWLIHDKVEYDKNFFEYPMIEKNYWIPLAEELSKNIDETIAFWKKLDAEEFLYTLDVFDELIQNTKSQKILDKVVKNYENRKQGGRTPHNRLCECYRQAVKACHYTAWANVNTIGKGKKYHYTLAIKLIIQEHKENRCTLLKTQYTAALIITRIERFELSRRFPDLLP